MRGGANDRVDAGAYERVILASITAGRWSGRQPLLHGRLQSRDDRAVPVEHGDGDAVAAGGLGVAPLARSHEHDPIAVIDDQRLDEDAQAVRG
jgi:hypothetical protein